MSKKYLPPRWPDKLLERLCAPEFLEEVLGDLHERYSLKVQRVGETKARKQYWREVLAYLRPSVFKRQSSYRNKPIRTTMLKNYIIIAFRNLIRQKGYSLLNITGLSLGLACTFLITLWIQDEMNYDGFHESGDRLYRVMRHVYSGEHINTAEGVTWNIASTLQEEYPEVQNVAVTYPTNLVINSGGNSLREQGLYATPAFFTMFTWHLIQGEPEEVLSEPTSVAISVSLAKKYFGDDWRTQAIGGTIHDDVNGRGDFRVSGVFEDVPHQSSLQFDFVLPMEVYVKRNDWLFNWNNSGVRIYTRLHEGADGAALSAKIFNMQNQHIEDFRSDLFLQPYTDQHLYSSFQDGVLTGGRIEYVRMFAIVALVIIVIACINFMNLATARSMRRSKEVGVRKAIGAGKRTLVSQFMGESFLLVFMSFVLAIGLVLLALPFFNALTEKEIILANVSASTLMLFAGIGVLVALLAGIYPAFYLSSFDAVRILRGTFRLGSQGSQLRQGLVVFQFAVSILLIGGTIIIYQQMDYIQSKNLGLSRENVVYMPLEGPLRENFATIKEELRRQPGIAAVTSLSENPLDVGSNTHSVSWRGKDPDSQVSMTILMADFDFLEVMKMNLVEGRDFSPQFGSDTFNCIINQKAKEAMNFDEPVGEELSFWGSTGNIVGVVEDFHMASLYTEIEPMIIQLRPRSTGIVFLRTEPGRAQEAVAGLQEIAQQFNPEYPFEYHFLDESFRQTYRSEMVVGTLATYFTAFALFIACLGLFGLAAYAAERRTKEIGIRKVLGATVTNIVGLLSQDFLKLVVIGSLISVPIAWYVMHQWLQNFAYSIEISGWVFALAGLLALIVALLTVSFQSIKAAVANPVDSLRSE
uniref:ABC transporter permease n=1 Tax=Roseihalotalea indica TaxID=2867963 RepID=A0AA49JF57_9BACT|nr:ABC transporter permease [Tunicatimonas sp. TK19036]